jgi:hypothetical protein
MLDKDFMSKIDVAVKTYLKENVWDDEESKVLEDFLEWMYHQYGIVPPEKHNGQS